MWHTRDKLYYTLLRLHILQHIAGTVAATSMKRFKPKIKGPFQPCYLFILLNLLIWQTFSGSIKWFTFTAIHFMRVSISITSVSIYGNHLCRCTWEVKLLCGASEDRLQHLLAFRSLGTQITYKSLTQDKSESFHLCRWVTPQSLVTGLAFAN